MIFSLFSDVEIKWISHLSMYSCTFCDDDDNDDDGDDVDDDDDDVVSISSSA